MLSAETYRKENTSIPILFSFYVVRAPAQTYSAWVFSSQLNFPKNILIRHYLGLKFILVEFNPNPFILLKNIIYIKFLDNC